MPSILRNTKPLKEYLKTELQEQCRALGLRDTGNKPELIERIRRCIAKKSTSVIPAKRKIERSRPRVTGKGGGKAAKKNKTYEEPEGGEGGEDGDDIIAQTVVGVEVDYDEEQAMIGASHAGILALTADDLSVQNVQGTPYIVNGLGLAYAEKAEKYKIQDNKIKKLEKDILALSDEVRSNEATYHAKFDALEDQVRTLSASVKELVDVRHRFLSTFKRDRLKNATAYDRAMIKRGNIKAHGGDARTDAMLYSTRQGKDVRTDIATYVELYGVEPAIVEAYIKHSNTIAAMNNYARIVAVRYGKLTQKLADSYMDFIDQLKADNYKEDYAANSKLFHAFTEYNKEAAPELAGLMAGPGPAPKGFTN